MIPAQRHSATSLEAAAAIAPRTPSLRERVYMAIADSADGLTDEEIQRVTGIGPSTQRPRRVELLDAGMIRDSGRTRLTAGRRKATIWVARLARPEQVSLF